MEETKLKQLIINEVDSIEKYKELPHGEKELWLVPDPEYVQTVNHVVAINGNVQLQPSDIGAEPSLPDGEVGTYLKRTETGLEWAEVKSGSGVVTHDETLSGDGTEASPLGVSSTYHDATKQDVINDIDTIRNKADTAVQNSLKLITLGD